MSQRNTRFQGTITRTKLLKEITDILTEVHSATAAQLFNHILPSKRFVCQIGDSDNFIFENWERLDPESYLYRRQISDNVYLFKDLCNPTEILYPFDLHFHEVKSTKIDLSEYDESYTKRLLARYITLKPEEREDKGMIAVALFREKVPIVAGFI